MQVKLTTQRNKKPLALLGVDKNHLGINQQQLLAKANSQLLTAKEEGTCRAVPAVVSCEHHAAVCRVHREAWPDRVR
jgi:hypothetical protein